MSSSIRAQTTWFVAALFCLVSAVGEGIHLIPGCGHAVELPGGCLLIGLAKPPMAAFWDGRWPGVRQADGGSPPCYDEDECAICRLCGQGKLPASGVDFRLVLPIPCGWLPISFQAPQSRSFGLFHARAPPRA